MTGVSIDSALSGLKLAAVLATGIWGVVSLLVDYRDDNDKITVWGRRALIGTVVSTLIAVSTQAIETYKQRQTDSKERDEAAARTAQFQTTLHEVRRGLYPINDVMVGADAYIQMSAPQVVRYMSRVNKQRTALYKAEGEIEGNSDTAHMPLSLYPHGSHERLAARLLLQFGVTVEFFRKHIPAETYVETRHKVEPDLRIMSRPTTVQSSLSITDDPTVILVHNPRLSASGQDIKFLTGEIVSVLDLYGAQAFVSIRYDDYDDAQVGAAEAIMSSELRFVKLEIGGVRIFLNTCQPVVEDVRVCSLSDRRQFSGIDLDDVPTNASH